MEKKIWTKPEISVVEFEANEYVATCASRTKYTHATSEQDNYWLYLEATGDNDFDYDGDRRAFTNAYEKDNMKGTLDVYEYFKHMVDSRETGAANSPDQLFFFGAIPSNEAGFTACTNGGDIPDDKFTYDGWWTKGDTSEVSAKAKIWWDEDSERIHAAWGVNTHSA